MTRELTNGFVSLSLDLKNGAAIRSLVELSTSKQWVAQANFLENSEGFAKTGFGDWYEMFPTIAGENELDHGDVWQGPWDEIEYSIKHSVHRTLSKSSSLELQRGIELSSDQSKLTISYLVSNNSSSTQSFLWAFHPLSPLTNQTQLTVGGVQGWVLVDPKFETHFEPKTRPLSQVPLGTGSKWWSARESKPIWVRLNDGEGNVLSMTFSQEVAHLGVWIDNKAFSKTPTIALEPAIGWYDDLKTAQTNGSAASLPPGGQLSWNMTLALES